ncbi:MAG: hypothetical protein J7480_03760 [Microbacteriaceae bacterium]|nr:hypothetical protein [Microbacteriaceae bacterium]
MRRHGRLRALRGLAAGTTTSYLALLFHVLGGGEAPSPLAFAACAAAVTWAAMLIGRSRPSLPLLTIAVAVGQLLLHGMFAMTTGGASLVPGGDGSVPGHAHAHAAGALDLLGAAGTGGGRAMWAAHVTAGLLTIVLIRSGERLLHALAVIARTAARSIVRVAQVVLAAVAAVSRTPRRAPARSAALAPRLVLLAAGVGSAVVRRGPPALV